MGLRAYFRRRRERESPLSQEQLAAVYSAADQGSERPVAGVVENLDRRKLQQLQSSVLAIMKEHGIDPMRPDPSRFADPEVQRALQEAVLRHGSGETG